MHWIKKLKATNRMFGYNFLECTQRLSANYFFSGSNHPGTKLTENEVVIICERVFNGESVHRIAIEYSVSLTTVRTITQGKGWKLVDRKLVQKQRNVGSDFWSAKLKESDIPLIENLIVIGEAYINIAKKFGVSTTVIADIAKGKTWKHSKQLQPIAPHSSIGSGNYGAKLTEQDVTVIKQLLLEGASYDALAEKYELHPKSISAIARGRTWKHVLPDLKIPKRIKKLNEAQVREIKLKISTGKSDVELAQEYSVSRRLIRGIRLGECWNNV